VREILTITVLAGMSELVSEQSTMRPKYLDRALVQHNNSEITVIANDSLPLLQAIDALRLEYGWQINWESAPCSSRFDVVDDTDPKWRAAHPADKGVTRPAGGLFTATLPEPNNYDQNSKHLVLSKLVEEYNATDNPGKYMLRADADGQFTVVGTRVRDETGKLRETSPLLDTPLTLAKGSRNAEDTINSILSALESVTGQKVILAELSHSLLLNTKVTMGGEKIPARELLKQAFASTKQPLQYDLGFNPDMPAYILSTSLAMREEDDGLGGKRLVPIDRRP